MNSPTVSVVMPAWNSATFIRPAIESVLQQSFQDFEFIVVDDGSEDNTAAIVKEYGGRVRYLWKPNGGQASARNCGIDIARGKYIAFIDHDDLWRNDKLELQVVEISKHEDVGMVTCDSVLFSGEYELGTECVRINELTRDKLITKLLLGNCLGSCSKAILKAECLDAVGHFNPARRMAEDWDLWLRVAQRYVVRSIELPLVRYRIHERNFSSLSGELNLQNELEFLNGVFSAPDFQKRWCVKRRAFAKRYLSAAMLSRELQDRRSVICNLARAVALFPSVVCSNKFIGLVLYALRSRHAGRSNSDKLPGR